MVQSLPRSDSFRILFNSPELSEVQRSGFHLFLRRGIAEELSKISCIQLKHKHFLIEIFSDTKNFRLLTPENSYRDCILKMKSYTCKLYVQTRILFKDKLSGELLYQTPPEWVLLADLPIMTKRGHFVINGSPRVIVHQVGRAPGIYFKKVLKVKKDVNNKARFYGDIIPRKGVWVRLQINKKGEIECKLKKSKKLRAEMVQKCLQLLEKERSPISFLQKRDLLTDRHKEILNLTGSTSRPVSIFSPLFLKEKSFDRSVLDRRTEHTNRYSTFTQKQHSLKFSVNTSFLTGISVDNCSYSQTRQTQAFVIGGATNKVRSVVYPLWYHTMPWFPIVRNTGVRSQAISQLERIFGFSGSISVALTEQYLQGKTHLANNLSKAKTVELLSNHSSIQINPSLKDVLCHPYSILGSKQSLLSFADCLLLPLGSKMYGEKRLDFTKAEREAFTDVYTSFYKNEVQDTKERVSVPPGKEFANSGKQDSLKSSLSLATKRSKQTKKKRFAQKTERNACLAKTSFWQGIQPNKKRSKSRITKKQNVPNNLEKIRDYLYQLFKRPETYDLGAVGREKINTRFGSSITETQLTSLDIKEGINWLSKLREGKKEVDDIDHSQNRRVRTSSELVQAQLEIGITRLRNLVTKRVNVKTKFLQRRTQIEQVRRLPFALQATQFDKQNACSPDIGFSLSNGNKNHFDSGAKCTKPKSGYLLALQKPGLCKSEAYTKTSFLYARTTPSLHNVYSTTDLPRYRSETVCESQDLTQSSKPLTRKVLLLPNRKSKQFVVVEFGQSRSKGSTTCFIKRNAFIGVACKNFVLAQRSYAKTLFWHGTTKFLQKARRDLESQTNFSVINPYCATHHKKKRYYATLSEWKDCYQKVDLRHSSTSETLLLREQPFQEQSFDTNLLTAKQKRRDVFDQIPSQDISYMENLEVSKFLGSELFSTKPINGALREFFSSSPLSQYMDQTNPLADITHKRRISSLGAGGVSRESAGMAIRGIHPTHYGRICPIETPEGKNAGLVNSLAFYAKINNQGFIETPYYQVTNGQIQHELGFSFYSAEQESKNGLYIAPNDIKQSKSKLLSSNVSTMESIPVRVADAVLDLFKKVNPYQVHCIGVSPVQILSVATSLIPFLEHNDANRALMGSNMQRQAVSLMISERPFVGTGLEARVLAESGHLVESKVSGFVSSVSAHKIVVERLLHNLIPALYKSSLRCQNKVMQKRSYAKTKFWQRNACKELIAKTKHFKTCCHNGVDPVCLNQSNPNPVTDKDLVLTELTRAERVGFWEVDTEQRKKTLKLGVSGLPVTGLLEVGDPQIVLISPSMRSLFACGTAIQWSVNKQPVRKIKSSVTQTNRYQTFSFQRKEFALLPVTHPINSFTRSNQETCLVQKPLVEEGDWIQKGDMLSDCSAGQKGELSVGRNVLIAYIPWQGYNFEDAIVVSDRLVKEQLYSSLHIERYTIVVNDFKDKVVDTNEWFTGDLPGVDSKRRSHLQKSGLPTIGTILREGDILVGKIRYSKKKPATPHERLVCDILGEHDFSVQNHSLYVPKGVHEARVLSYKIKKRFEKALKNSLRPAGAPKLVHIFLGEKRNLQVGDKMSGRHGNKGIVSTVLPKQDMPYLADGSPIDILLNPLGVPSRMNVGQVLECLLGLASTYLHQNFKITAFDELYGVEASQSLVFLKLYQARLQSGQNWLFQVNFPGKVRLTDGRSGECLDQWVTVGRAYMLKLIHMVNEKIHARAIGPYALVTQQPLKGRAHKGGQRLGEMEVWAVEGFGAAYILQELLTKKSDDSIGRKEVLKAMLPRSASFLDSRDPFGQPIQLKNTLTRDSRSHTENEALVAKTELYKNGVFVTHVLGQPDIFKVLICELQALCLDVGVYSMRTESFQRTFLGML